MPPCQSSNFATPRGTQIKIIIVGCGFAGLACAIESKRKGHDVMLLEKRMSIETLGDVISFAPNTGRIFERWGLGDKLMAVCTQHAEMHLHAHTGELLGSQTLPQKVFGSNSYNGRRGEIHNILLHHAFELGVDVRFGVEVVNYWEEGNVAGVITEEGRFEGHVVVGADGMRSKARQLVLGYNDRPKPSGYAIYRAWFNARDNNVHSDPLTAHFAQGDVFHAWTGEDVHLLAMSMRGGKEICWLLTHRDSQNIGESWSFPGKITDALAVLNGWDPASRAIVSKASFCVDWKLVHRDPLLTWVSPRGLTVLIGDAAHPFLPTSIQGASQGVEDGVTLAVVLQISGKGNIAQATRVFEHLRYDRVRKAQIMGEETRDKFHAKPEDREKDVELPFPEWLLNFDAEKEAYSEFQGVASELGRNGYTYPSVRLAYRNKQTPR